MSQSRISITKSSGKITPESRTLLNDVFSPLKDGEYEITIRRSGYHFRGRYKYYFGYLLSTIIDSLNLRVIDGEKERVMATEELHAICKEQFNPVRVYDPFEKVWKVRGGSTKDIPDDEFIAIYEEQVAAHFQTEFGIELLTRQEWVEKRRES